MIAPLVFHRPELLTEGVKEPLSDSQGTLPRVTGWAWEGSQASATTPPPASSFLVPSPLAFPHHPPHQVCPHQMPPLSRVPGATRSPWLLSPPPTPPERDSGDPLVDESLKRQGFQGKVAAQDGVPGPSAMTLTWPWRARLGVGGAGCQPQGPPRGVV